MRGLLDDLIAHAQTTRSIRQIVMVERVGEALQGDGCDFLFQREERNVLSELLFFPDFKRSFHRNRNQIAAVLFAVYKYSIKKAMTKILL